jgi:hypothetical protein
MVSSGWYGRGRQAPDPARQIGWAVEYMKGTYGDPVARAKLALGVAEAMLADAKRDGLRWSRRRPLKRAVRVAREALAAAYEQAGQ